MVGRASNNGSVGLQVLNRSLNRTTKELSERSAELASGKKAFSSDAAAASVAAGLEALDTALSQGARNTRDFVSVAALRDGALDQVAALEDRRTELAAQASNGTFSDEQRAVLNEEFVALGQEINRIAETTEFNGINLFDGTTLTAQVGADSSASSQIELRSVSIRADETTDISTQSGAQSFLEISADQRTAIANARASDGAAVARLEAAAANNESASVALRQASARLTDIDVAETAAEQARLGILADGNVALQAQANQNQQNVLNLLR